MNCRPYLVRAERRLGRPVLRAVRFQIACRNRYGVAIPQVVDLVDQTVRKHIDAAIAHAVVYVKRIGAAHLDRKLRQSFWRIRPRPGSRKQTMKTDIPDAITQHLVRMSMNHRHRLEYLFSWSAFY